MNPRKFDDVDAGVVIAGYFDLGARGKFYLPRTSRAPFLVQCITLTFLNKTYELNIIDEIVQLNPYADRLDDLFNGEIDAYFYR